MNNVSLPPTKSAKDVNNTLRQAEFTVGRTKVSVWTHDRENALFQHGLERSSADSGGYSARNTEYDDLPFDPSKGKAYQDMIDAIREAHKDKEHNQDHNPWRIPKDSYPWESYPQPWDEYPTAPTAPFPPYKPSRPPRSPKSPASPLAPFTPHVPAIPHVPAAPAATKAPKLYAVILVLTDGKQVPFRDIKSFDLDANWCTIETKKADSRYRIRVTKVDEIHEFLTEAAFEKFIQEKVQKDKLVAPSNDKDMDSELDLV